MVHCERLAAPRLGPLGQQIHRAVRPVVDEQAPHGDEEFAVVGEHLGAVPRSGFRALPHGMTLTHAEPPPDRGRLGVEAPVLQRRERRGAG